MTTSFKRGHLIIYEKDGWVYEDTKESIETERPCIRCGKMPTEQGHDACLGELKDVIYACCGHGVCKPYRKTIKEKSIYI